MRLPSIAIHRIVVLALAGGFVVATYRPFSIDLEMLSYRAASVAMAPAEISADVAVVAVDDDSLKRIGPWPWPRRRLGSTVDRLNKLGVATIGLLVPLDTAQTPPELERFKADGQSSSATRALVRKWEKLLDTDRALARAIGSAGNVVVAAEAVVTRQRRDMPSAIDVLRVPPQEGDSGIVRTALRPLLAPPSSRPAEIRAPLGAFADAAATAGVVGSLRDFDVSSGVRLAVPGPDGLLAGLVSRLSALATRRAAGDVRALADAPLAFGEGGIRAGPALRLLTLPAAPREDGHPVPVYSVAELWTDESLERKLRGKHVLLGITAPSVQSSSTGHDGVRYWPVTWQAFALASVLGDSYVHAPEWFFAMQRGLLVALALLALLAAPRLHALGNLLLGAIVALTLMGAGVAALVAEGLWLPVVLPALLVLVVQVLHATQRSELAQLSGRLQDAAEAHRTLAIHYQSQGQLDAAFEQFRKCPQNKDLLPHLYQLALDFEADRKLAKALAVFEDAIRIQPSYRDLEERKVALEAMERGAEIRGGPDGARKTRILTPEQLELTTLAHYELKEEIGRGAMASVYLAVDSKLRREVALKALSLRDDFDGDAREEARRRFMQEATAAARLNHSSIVTVYEAGEDDGLAYIAMDLVHGESLEAYADSEDLLPVAEVLEIGERVAEALEYAHARQVVHRDIKPGNILYDRGASTVKVTDFGIARLLNENRTHTGTVLGSPSYMSPEQAAGKKVDGRSDLYSLGVTLYQLLTGHLPFVGDSLANLIYQITTERPTAMRKFRADLHADVTRTINKTLQKSPGQRFATGGELARALARCRQRMVRA